MRLRNQQTIGDIISAWIDEKKLGEPIAQAKIESLWEQLMGKIIAKHTSGIKLRGQKLYITISNPTLKNELFYSKEKMMDILNKEFKQPLIKEVILY